MRSPILPQKCINFLKRLIKQREIRFSLQDSKRPKGLRLFDFFPNDMIMIWYDISIDVSRNVDINLEIFSERGTDEGVANVLLVQVAVLLFLTSFPLKRRKATTLGLITRRRRQETSGSVFARRQMARIWRAADQSLAANTRVTVEASSIGWG